MFVLSKKYMGLYLFNIVFIFFQISLSTLVTLHNNYLRSKEEKNVFNRYSLMREMIKVRTIFARTFWRLRLKFKFSQTIHIFKLVLYLICILHNKQKICSFRQRKRKSNFCWIRFDQWKVLKIMCQLGRNQF